MPSSILHLAAESIRSSAPPRSLPRTAQNPLRALSRQGSLFPRTAKSWVPGRSKELGAL